jgi:ABC-type multidrug transport system fused ATPase/permease subunit
MFLKDPPILILDEAVSAVDSEAEAHIQEVLRTLAADRTTIVIAHRLASLMLADRVILIEDGRVVEQGSHEQLLGADGPYTRLFQHQFQPQLRRSAVETTSSAA